MQVNLLPFVIEALGQNKRIYKDIDKLYQSNKYKFYKAAKEHELYNHQIIKEGSLIQEEYCKKVLGAFAGAEGDININQELQQIIKKGFRYTWVYLENHNNFDLQQFSNAFMKKFKNPYDNYGNSIEYHVVILIFLSMNSERTIVEDDFYNGFLQQLKIRWEHYNDTKCTRIAIDKASSEDRLKIKMLKKAIYKEFGTILNFDDIINEQFEQKKLDSPAFLFDYENLSSIEIFKDIKFTEKDIDEILYLYVLYNLDQEQSNNFDFEITEDAAKFLITHMYIKYLIKAYKQVKEMYFDNNKETMFVELEGLEKSLNATEDKLLNTKVDLNKANEEIEQLEKENARLIAKLEVEKRNREELNSLREFIFNLDKQEEYSEDEIDLKLLENYKAIVIGGHEKWQQRMKKLLPNFEFIHPNNLNFDTRLLDNTNIIFVYVNYLNHGLYYKVMENIAGKGIKVTYLNQQNEDLVLQKIFQSILEVENDQRRIN